MAVLVSGLPEQFERLIIALGMTVVPPSIVGFLHAVPTALADRRCAAIGGRRFRDGVVIHSQANDCSC